ncbi:hypothetical protein [Tianweitania sediminis]|uniref:Uncharacterized protein n=1 Tax=Tianweitania sediminis TaxID=1502156 RepID=A0A8J7R1R8_9HYPH|nr:hypothetical protein [Tianweitania sediminis]MBP0440630.1 hypothetical protein [Tianweitania sediminis]HEV7416859.1 hypothetical protein [Tianweitania sediminis]
MLDAYGLPIESRAYAERRIEIARQGYELNCLRRGMPADWSTLPSDERHMWLMTAEAMLERALSDDMAAVA